MANHLGAESEEVLFHEILKGIGKVRYGCAEIVIHDSKGGQIEYWEKIQARDQEITDPDNGRHQYANKTKLTGPPEVFMKSRRKCHEKTMVVSGDGADVKRGLCQ